MLNPNIFPSGISHFLRLRDQGPLPCPSPDQLGHLRARIRSAVSKLGSAPPSPGSGQLRCLLSRVSTAVSWLRSALLPFVSGQHRRLGALTCSTVSKPGSTPPSSSSDQLRHLGFGPFGHLRAQTRSAVSEARGSTNRLLAQVCSAVSWLGPAPWSPSSGLLRSLRARPSSVARGAW